MKVTLSIKPSESDIDASEWVLCYLHDAQLLAYLTQQHQASKSKDDEDDETMILADKEKLVGLT